VLSAKTEDFQRISCPEKSTVTCRCTSCTNSNLTCRCCCLTGNLHINLLLISQTFLIEADLSPRVLTRILAQASIEQSWSNCSIQCSWLMEMLASTICPIMELKLPVSTHLVVNLSSAFWISWDNMISASLCPSYKLFSPCQLGAVSCRETFCSVMVHLVRSVDKQTFKAGMMLHMIPSSPRKIALYAAGSVLS
jgi:hypothetical protein